MPARNIIESEINRTPILARAGKQAKTASRSCKRCGLALGRRDDVQSIGGGNGGEEGAPFLPPLASFSAGAAANALHPPTARGSDGDVRCYVRIAHPRRIAQWRPGCLFDPTAADRPCSIRIAYNKQPCLHAPRAVRWIVRIKGSNLLQ
jgi:hypothetical protein